MTAHEQRQYLSSYGRLGILLVIVGALLAIDSAAGWKVAPRLWPFLLTVLGAGFIGLYGRRSRREGAYVAVGVYLLLLSGLMLFCSLSVAGWGALATLWPLFIGFFGISFLAAYTFGGRVPLALLVGLLLISVSVVFLFLFSLKVGAWWVALILAGASFFVFDRARMPR